MPEGCLLSKAFYGNYQKYAIIITLILTKFDLVLLALFVAFKDIWQISIYTVSQKKESPIFLGITLGNVDRF